MLEINDCQPGVESAWLHMLPVCEETRLVLNLCCVIMHTDNDVEFVCTYFCMFFHLSALLQSGVSDNLRNLMYID